MTDDDPVGTARGLAVGLLLGAAMWAAIIRYLLHPIFRLFH